MNALSRPIGSSNWLFRCHTSTVSEKIVTMAHDSELTILLTLKDRTAYTCRWMAYLDSIKFPFNVLIADGGFDEDLPRVLSDASRFPNVSYEYVRYPPDRCYADYFAKIENALSRIQTPFVALADNDDFFVVHGLQESVDFLRLHPEYATCGGQIACFSVLGPEGVDPEQRLYGARVTWRPSFIQQPPLAENARTRVRNHCAGFVEPYYHVQRTTALRRRFSAVKDLNPTDICLQEYLLGFLASVAGETRQLDTLYLVRQQNSPDSSQRAHEARYGDWFDRMLAPSWSVDFSRMVDIVSSALAEADGLSLEEARACVIMSYRLSAAPGVLSNLTGEPTVPHGVSVIGSALLAKLPRDYRLWKMARQLHRSARWLRERAVWRKLTGSRVVAQEFARITAFLTSNAGLPPSARS